MRRQFGTEQGRRTRAIVDDQVLADDFRHLERDDARDEIRPAAGRIRHDQPDRLARVRLRVCTDAKARSR